MLIRTLLVALSMFATAALAATPAEIAERAAASVKRSPKWDRIEVQRAKADDYALIVWYKQKPADFAEVERDTGTVTRAVLKRLTELKVLPQAAPLYVVVRGRMPEKGETGKPLVRVFGVSRYDNHSDQIAFERNK